MRAVLFVAHTTRQDIADLVRQSADQFKSFGFEVRMIASEAATLVGDVVTIVDSEDAAEGCELVLALGGDGTFLGAAELARPAGVPMLGVNMGHVGFLAESEPDMTPYRVAAFAAGAYTVEERVTIDAQVVVDGAVVSHAWALNEASLERTNRERMLEIAVAVDKRPLLRFGCDGLLCSTPSGSTAYAFSAGGPIIWPNVDAMLLVPNAAHALFSRPIVVAPTSVVDIDLVSEEHDGVLSCDGRRSVPVPVGARIVVRRGRQPVRVVRFGDLNFTDRLVSKFHLPVRTLREVARPGEEEPEVGVGR